MDKKAVVHRPESSYDKEFTGPATRSVTAYEDLWHWGKWMPNLLCCTGSELTLNPWDLKGSSPVGVEAYRVPVTNGVVTTSVSQGVEQVHTSICGYFPSLQL